MSRANVSPLARVTVEELGRKWNAELPQLGDAVARIERLKYRLAGADTTLTLSDDILLVDATDDPVTVALPDAGLVPGKDFYVQKTDAGANDVTLDGFGSQTIDGAGTLAWNTQWMTKHIAAVRIALPATYGWVVLSGS